jgi:phosphate transport system substrate-binding protein
MRLVFQHIYKVGYKVGPALAGLGLCLFLGTGCRNGSKGARETPISGTINISVDESFKPIIDSEIKVFESSYPDAKVIPHYKAEAECLRDLASDSTRMIIVTRGLTPDEEKFYLAATHVEPSYDILAYDAISVIVNNASKDSIFEIKDIRSMLNGTDKQHQVVLDGLSSTSTVRYAIDSILQGKPLAKTVTAARSSPEVINYVAENPRAVGFIGVSWIGDQEDPVQQSFLKRVNIASVRCISCVDQTYVKPYPANITLKRYPLVRGLYYILKENYSGIGNNFVNFLQFERGQLIFHRAYLVPARMPFEIRDAQINK